MSWFDAIVLGTLQGLAEFLPISSSGHLALFQYFFSRETSIDQHLFLNILLHFSTMLALIVYFRKDIFAVVANLFLKGKKSHSFFVQEEYKLVISLFISLLATSVIGLALKKTVINVSDHPGFIGGCFVVTAVVLWLSKNFNPSKTFKEFSYLDALLIGVAQGIAVFPGLSRSGLTICMALFLGMQRETSAKYSLFLSIPTIAAVAFVEVFDLSVHDLVFAPQTLAAMLISAITGFFAIHWILFFVKQRKFHYFTPYLLLLGFLLFFA